MVLFENENINITKIYTVDKYYLQASPHLMKCNICPPTYELIFFISGRNNVEFGSQRCIDIPDSVRYIPKGNFKGVYDVEILESGTCLDVYFDTTDPMPNEILTFPNLGYLKNDFLKIYHIWQSKQFGYYVDAMSQFYQIIKQFRANRCNYISSEYDQRIVRIRNYIADNYRRRQFDYQELCQVSGLKYSYFCEFFKKAFHMTPVQYVTTMKIEYAKELLITKRYNITEIAEACGYDNVCYFSKVFKQATGASPSEYRDYTL